MSPRPIDSLEVLDEQLAQPLVARLQRTSTSRVFIVAGTALTALPIDRCTAAFDSGIEFGFLPTGRALGFARARRYPSAKVPVFAVGDHATEHAIEIMTRPNASIAIVVDPTRSLAFAPLEAEAVARSAGHLDVRTLTGDPDAVDRDTLRHAAESVGILHVIGHGSFVDASPYRSGMYVDRDDGTGAVWTVAEIFTDVEAPAGRLAVLSGCETGRTRSNLVSEEVSLPAAFLAAGYAAVVGSRWPVDDLAAALLMGDLYDRWLAGGVSIARAVSDSCRWLRELSAEAAAARVRELGAMVEANSSNEPETHVEVEATRLEFGPRLPFADPAHWAAFFVSGDASITADGPDRRVPTPH